MLIYDLCFSSLHGEVASKVQMLSSLSNATSKPSSTHTSVFSKSGLGHVSIFRAFRKIRIPHEKYCKSATKLSSANLPIDVHTDLSSADILAALKILLFLVIVKLPAISQLSKCVKFMTFREGCFKTRS